MQRHESLTCDDVSAVCTTDLLLAGLWVSGLQQVDHLSVVGNSGPIAGGGETNSKIHTRIVMLP